MSRVNLPSGDVFEMTCDTFEVTSCHRPDPTWRYVDLAGHEHRWFTEGKPATNYHPTARYDVPSLIWVKDGEEYWEGDDEPHPVGHNECKICGERIEPQFTADANRVYIPGLRRCFINDQPVSHEEFQRRYEEQRPK